MRDIRRARLVSVASDEHEFYYLLDKDGRLHVAGVTSDNNWFNADNGESIKFLAKEISEDNGYVSIVTRLGNTFKFKLL